MADTIHEKSVPAVLEELKSMRFENVRLMEVCGTHTMEIARAGIKRLLPEGVTLLSGPGCPVCVTPPEAIDLFLELSENASVMITSYGDMLRVPGSRRGDTLLRRRVGGASVRIVYSPMDALQLAETHPEKEIVFLGVGFETTAPGTAAAILSAKERGLKNFTVLPLMRAVEPALRTLRSADDFSIHGFLCPGHVAVITGEKGFRFLPEEYGIPAVISGFEPGDILRSLLLLLRQIRDGKARLENTYGRLVSPEGNALARDMMERVLEPQDALWRGLGLIPGSAWGIRREFADFDASVRFGLSFPAESAPTPCRCGDVISGRLAPQACSLFGSACTPEDPFGPCMVSGEGSCAAAYKYQ